MKQNYPPDWASKCKTELRRAGVNPASLDEGFWIAACACMVSPKGIVQFAREQQEQDAVNELLFGGLR